MAAATKKKKRKEEAHPWKAGASSGHTTNLKQSILETFDIYGFEPLILELWVKCYTTVLYNSTNRFDIT
jgi:hypothetical protein